MEDTRDGTCYVGCYNYTAKRGENVTVFLKSDGICDLDCNETNGICDPDCNMDKDCEKICAKEGESCEDVPCCEGLVCCPGEKICRPAALKRPCCGNGYCEVSYYMLERYPRSEKLFRGSHPISQRKGSSKEVSLLYYKRQLLFINLYYFCNFIYQPRF